MKTWLRFGFLFASLLAAAVCLYLAGQAQGRKWAIMESWAIGYDQGYNSGISDAAAAYDSGGIVNASTGKVTKRAAPAAIQ